MTDFQQFFYYFGLFSAGWFTGKFIKSVFSLMEYDYSDRDRD